MKQTAKKVIKAGKDRRASHKFFSTFVICLIALVLMSSFNKNDVSSLVNTKAFPVPAAKLLHAPDESVVYTIRFEFESAAITREAAVILNQLIKMLKADKTLHVNIEGHADKFYDEDYNLKISEKRANNVRKYLLFRNIDKNRVTTAFSGSSKPDPKNTHTPWLDRRADITVYKK